MHFLNRHWPGILILRFLLLAVQLLEFEVKSLKLKRKFKLHEYKNFDKAK